MQKPKPPFEIQKAILMVLQNHGLSMGTVERGAQKDVNLYAFLQYRDDEGIHWAGDLPAGVHPKKSVFRTAPHPWPFEKYRVDWTYVTLELEKIHYTISTREPELTYVAYPVAFGPHLWHVRVPFQSHNTDFLSAPPCGAWLGNEEKIGTLRFAARADIYPVKDPHRVQTIYSADFSTGEGALVLVQKKNDEPFPLPFYSGFAHLPSLAFSEGKEHMYQEKVRQWIVDHRMYGTPLWYFMPFPQGKEKPVEINFTKPLPWGSSLHPGDSLLFQNMALIFVKDQGKEGWLDPQDIVWVDLNAPLCQCTLGALIQEPVRGFLFCPHGSP